VSRRRFRLARVALSARGPAVMEDLEIGQFADPEGHVIGVIRSSS
jgi:hypothetical protein